uniref:Uncharacterized protein n=1 Tax=Triticum urartu TaxID=4572 RepID=A0A8R7TUG2_TRIUA
MGGVREQLGAVRSGPSDAAAAECGSAGCAQQLGGCSQVWIRWWPMVIRGVPDC